MTTNQTPDSALDAAVERVMPTVRLFGDQCSLYVTDQATHTDMMNAQMDIRVAIRTELEQAIAAGRRDALENVFRQSGNELRFAVGVEGLGAMPESPKEIAHTLTRAWCAVPLPHTSRRLTVRVRDELADELLATPTETKPTEETG